MEKTDSQIFEEFSSQLCEWANNGKTPAAGNQDIRYGLELQKKRLENNHATMEYQLECPDDMYNRLFNTEFSDLHYTNKLVRKSYK